MLTAEYDKHPVFSTFRDFIATKGLNMSHQRILILEAFLSAGPPTNVDDLYIKLRNRYSTLGRSTVYRTLKLLVECGIAREVVMAGAPVHYQRCPATETDHCHQAVPGVETMSSGTGALEEKC